MNNRLIIDFFEKINFFFKKQSYEKIFLIIKLMNKILH